MKIGWGWGEGGGFGVLLWLIDKQKWGTWIYGEPTILDKTMSSIMLLYVGTCDQNVKLFVIVNNMIFL